MKRRVEHISILIPARDEAELLPRLLHSVAEARMRLGRSVTSNVVLVSDDSRDDTAAVAARLVGAEGMVAEVSGRCVGAARRAAAGLALERFRGEPGRHWLANTDADCQVPPDWLLRQLVIAERGYSAVAGVVSVDSFRHHAPEVAERFLRSYVLHADGTHPHIHGANLGIRADAYLRAGGWSPLESSEDHDLWRRLGASGARRLSDATLHVVTSGRREGRAPGGFAGALAAHNRKVA